VVNVGIGGSDLGPVMAYEALRHYTRGTSSSGSCPTWTPPTSLRRPATWTRRDAVHHLLQDVRHLETLTNATSAGLVVSALGRGGGGQALRGGLTNAERVAKFGIDTANMFGFWDWVGGRYSMDSAIGLSNMIALGPEGFYEMLAGFHEMDEHFRTAPLEQNLPVLMGCSRCGTATSSACRATA
jgi:glucose-6-phosphate isomerase